MELDWDQMYQEATNRMEGSEPVASGTYHYVVPVTRNGKVYAVRVVQSPLQGPKTSFHDLQMVSDPYKNMKKMVAILQRNTPNFLIPHLHHVKYTDDDMVLYAIFDWVHQAKFASQANGYQSEIMSKTLSSGMVDYIKRWTSIPTELVDLQAQWRDKGQIELTLAHLQHARAQYEDFQEEYGGLFQLFEISDRPFAHLEQSFQRMKKRMGCFIEVDRNLENVLYANGDQTQRPYFIDIDNHMVGDMVYGVIANLHRLNVNLQTEYVEQIMTQLTESVDSSYTDGWESDAPIYGEFELLRNGIRRMMVICKDHQRNGQLIVPEKFTKSYNALRQNYWGLPSVSIRQIKDYFGDFNRTMLTMSTSDHDQPDRGFLEKAGLTCVQDDVRAME